MSDGFTRQLAVFAAGGAERLITPGILEESTLALLDTVAVTFAGGADEAVSRLEDSLDACASFSCPSPWSGRTYAPGDAALLYGMASHMDDYDDVSMLAVCHPSAPVVCALTAAVTGGVVAGDVGGERFLRALAIGTEVTIRLGQAMGFRHYALGFHATSTLGVVGAAAAVGRLAGLDERRMSHALAIAASSAGGVRKNFGSHVKPLHVGLAAAAGLRAARMAACGVQGSSEPFAEGGYLAAYSGGETDRPAAAPALGAPFAIAEPGFERKRYPCCYMLHKTIEATLALRRERQLDLSRLRRAHVLLPQGGTKPLIHPFPGSGLHGKFSAPYAVLASLQDGRIDFTSFTDAAVARDGIQARLRDVIVKETDAVPPAGIDLGRLPVMVTLELNDGSTVEREVVASPGSREDPLTPDQLRRKWVDCLAHGLQGHIATGASEELFVEGMRLATLAHSGKWLRGLLTAGRAGSGGALEER